MVDMDIGEMGIARRLEIIGPRNISVNSFMPFWGPSYESRHLMADIKTLSQKLA